MAALFIVSWPSIWIESSPLGVMLLQVTSRQPGRFGVGVGVGFIVGCGEVEALGAYVGAAVGVGAIFGATFGGKPEELTDEMNLRLRWFSSK